MPSQRILRHFPPCPPSFPRFWASLRSQPSSFKFHPYCKQFVPRPSFPPTSTVLLFFLFPLCFGFFSTSTPSWSFPFPFHAFDQLRFFVVQGLTFVFPSRFQPVCLSSKVHGLFVFLAFSLSLWDLRFPFVWIHTACWRGWVRPYRSPLSFSSSRE